MRSLSRAIAEVRAGRSLTREAAAAAFGLLMEGTATEAEIESLLLALRAKGESADEIAGAAEALRAVMVRVAASTDRLIDTAGTGGGGITTFNISSAAALVAAGAGARVAKHGNRSHTSRCGSAEVFAALGIDIALPPARAARVLEEAGLVFLFAPQYHPAMRHAAPVRKRLGVSTVMNLVGPLANPAGARRQVMGVFERGRGPLVAEAHARLGSDAALVVHARVGMDEVSPAGITECWEVRGGTVRSWRLEPEDYGLGVEGVEALAGGEPGENAVRIERLLQGGSGDRPGRAAVLLNAAAAIYVSEDGLGFAEAVARARRSLEEDAAAAVLERLRRLAPRPDSG